MHGSGGAQASRCCAKPPSAHTCHVLCVVMRHAMMNTEALHQQALTHRAAATRARRAASTLTSSRGALPAARHARACAAAQAGAAAAPTVPQTTSWRAWRGWLNAFWVCAAARECDTHARWQPDGGDNATAGVGRVVGSSEEMRSEFVTYSMRSCCLGSLLLCACACVTTRDSCACVGLNSLSQ